MYIYVCIVCCYQLVWATDANDNYGCVHLVFSTVNVVSLTVTSFPPNPNFQGNGMHPNSHHGIKVSGDQLDS